MQKDEIKEILDKLYLDFEKAGLTAPEYSDLRDYITNLQEKNQDLSRMCELYSKSLYYAELKDYKSRCEKASELIRFIAFNSERPLTLTELNKVYNILQGVGKDD